ncbi:phosphatidate cytidylyltransferase [Chitinophaga skermanii]|uniref:Phosphatidate cytidylyltransferase n=1 Tax=Chitinophaga skermanii TaxID=331697 RepID=A0A327QAB1_9BACT|nr:phosphatidate cytidylyltransferase [Chitinophaga skermanii]RAJ01576.1 phosphatidate cytidylyltransferase [Chitinophaga skermanii]
MKTFITRTISALFFVAIMLGGILWNEASFFLLFFLVNLFALLEYFKLVRQIDPSYHEISQWHRYGLVVASCAMMMAFTGNSFGTSGGITLGFLGTCMTVIFLCVLPMGEILMGKNFSLKTLGYSALGLLYVTVPFGLLVNLRLSYNMQAVAIDGAHIGYLIPLLLIIFIWINDTMAYIVGSLIGRTPFFPSISPKKTTEGSVGGMILAVAAAGVFGHFWGYQWLAFQHWIVLSCIAAVFGTAGDLLESKLKRMAGVKDSGKIMPGHGGFLDRFDSLILATPFAWFYIYMFLL